MIDLDELEKLEAKATPGPWKFSHGDNFDHFSIWNDEAEFVVQDDSDVEPSTENLVAICRLRNAAPALIRELRAARKVIDAAKKAEEAFMKIDDGFFHGLVPPEFAIVSMALRELEGK